MPALGRLLTLTMLIWCIALAICTSANALLIGVADQTSAMFGDPRFRALDIRYVRRSVAWDALHYSWQRSELDAWLMAARADGARPLISFDHSRQSEKHRELPSAVRFAREFRHFRSLYPWVSDFATWNEANYCGEPTCHHAALVASYYRQMRHICPSCHVLGAELLDVPNMTQWVGQFRRALHGADASIWGLHNYIGANRLHSASTRALLAITRAQIWFTETGGLVSRHNHSTSDFPQSASHAGIVTRFVFERLAALSKRITRIYVYQWDGAGPKASWDSGLIAPGGKPRPAYTVFVAELKAFGLPPGLPVGSLP
jgi:hypothetical protein